jgi:hypothetical protein
MLIFTFFCDARGETSSIVPGVLKAGVTLMQEQSLEVQQARTLMWALSLCALCAGAVS